jgi:site-specific DNA recombinase
VRVAVYTRISSDPNGHALGVERQRLDCYALAVANDWTVVSTFTDNDLSAYSGKPRPGYRDLVDFIKAGAVDAVLAWHPDRLHRSPAELEEFIGLLEAHQVTVHTVQAGQWDLSTPSGRLIARQLGSVARYESEHKSARVRRALEQRASMGRPHGRTAYGYRRAYAKNGTSREIPNEDEAKVVREIAERIVAGDSINEICRSLNDRGIASPMGVPWRKNMVRHVVLRERNVALRVHHGQVMGPADWPPILDTGLWEQVRAVLRDPQRRTSTGTAAVHLLSGIARCGVCGGKMRAGMNRTVASYRCMEKSCVSRARRDVDDLVVKVILARLSKPDAVEVFRRQRDPAAADAAAEAEALRARLDIAADEYADGRIDARQLERITAKLRPQIAAAEARARIIDDFPLLDGLLGIEDVEKVWRELPLTRRRAVVDLLLEVRILRAKPGARVFDPESIEITPKVEP